MKISYLVTVDVAKCDHDKRTSVCPEVIRDIEDILTDVIDLPSVRRANVTPVSRKLAKVVRKVHYY